MAKTDQKQFQAAWAKAWLEEGDENARMLLVESCMGLVRKAAMALLWTDLDWDDLEAEGVAALYEATAIYRPESGEFSACAFITIRRRMFELALSSGSAVTSPRSRVERKLRYHLRKKMAVHEDAGMSPGQALEAAAEDLGVPLEAAAAHLAARSPVSLSVPPSGDDEERGLQIAAADRPSEDAIDQDQGRTRRILTEIFAGLGDLERDILTRRLVPRRPVSLETLAAEYGMTRERIGHVQREGMRHVRLELERRGLELEDLL
ncbi:sigma-70 family RNA polymerase sigma factor [Salipiger bermudensis]|uniref:sigma-70 family RNA polymerase sigma factor n=1 Tax=Salipiger bermudensis TaxID=344736 RepID=UPI001CD7802D|nr:sigma-70 family RNA polymerase sigma factor [Salipiger bermudensis]MCA0961967.1 sigma-70 family RNA polymerase sigma factor [Salipiger bermudensis]